MLQEYTKNRNVSTYSAYKAGVMPNVTKGLQELVSGLDGKLTTMAPSPKQTVEVFFSKTKPHDIYNILYIFQSTDSSLPL